jgi:hypothetical protein
MKVVMVVKQRSKVESMVNLILLHIELKMKSVLLHRINTNDISLASPLLFSLL